MPAYESFQIITRPGDSTGVGTTIATFDATGLRMSSPAKLILDNNFVHDKIGIPMVLVATTVSSLAFGPINEGRWQVAAVS